MSQLAQAIQVLKGLKTLKTDLMSDRAALSSILTIKLDDGTINRDKRIDLLRIRNAITDMIDTIDDSRRLTG